MVLGPRGPVRGYPGEVSASVPAPALKEWAVIYDAILSGRQIIDLRKGGIRETERHFAVRARRFWLYPGYEHQRRELLKPAVARTLDRVLLERPPDEVIRVPGWADIVATVEVSTDDEIARLDPDFVWTREYAESRLHWKPKQPLHVLVLRAYALREPLEIPEREAYRGCASWTEFVDVPADPAQLPADPVLTDAEFEARSRALLARLPAGAALTPP